MTRNGNAITLNRSFYDRGVRNLNDFENFIHSTRDKRHIMGVVHPSSMHNLILRYWLAAGGIDPNLDVELQNISPAQMMVDLQNATIDGYCVGEPWNYRAAVEGIGFTVATDLEIWNGHPGKVLGVREDWANAYPNTMDIPFERPRDRTQIMEDPLYYNLRNRALEFLYERSKNL